MAVEAGEAGRGGITMVARATGAARSTVTRGVDELDSGATDSGRVRRAGAGRKRAETVDAELTSALERLVDPDTRGDPESPLRWTIKSTRQLSAALTGRGHRCSEWLVRRLLHDTGYSLQAAAKQIEGTAHPDRDAQFRYVNDQVREHHSAGQPVISVDTKKKELVGQYKNGGSQWRPSGNPERVKTHDFPDQQLGKAIPYGVYDIAADSGWVSVGADHDTAAFAVATIRRWWQAVGADRYPHADEAADHRRRGRLQRLSHPAVENRTPRAGRRAGSRSRSATSHPHRQVEQDRAPAVLPHHVQLTLRDLARPPGRGQPDRGDHHPHRADRARRTRPRRIPQGNQDQRQADS